MVSWIAPRVRAGADEQADTRISFAPSARAASRPVSAFVRPGPVVVNTSTGRPVAKWLSAAANAAPLSWRKWQTCKALADIACHNAAIAPPETPKACRTPARSRPSTSTAASVGRTAIAAASVEGSNSRTVMASPCGDGRVADGAQSSDGAMRPGALSDGMRAAADEQRSGATRRAGVDAPLPCRMLAPPVRNAPP